MREINNPLSLADVRDLVGMALYRAKKLTSGGGGPPAGRDYYFAVATGSDTTGNGTQATPYKTITKAMSLSLNSGDRLLFNGGETFTGPLTVPASNITITSYGTGKATITAAGNQAVFISAKGQVTVDNLTLRTTGAAAIVLKSDSTAASNNITVSNCDISGTAGGLQVGPLDDLWTVTGCNIHDCADHGLVLQGGPHHEIAGNTFSNNAHGVSGGHDLYVHSAGTSWVDAVFIHDNTFTTTTDAAVTLRREFVRFFNNTITFGTGGIIGVAYFDECPIGNAGHPTYIYNNLIKGVPAGGAGLYIGAANPDAGGTTTLTDFIITNNTVIGNGADTLYEFDAEGTSQGYEFPTNIRFHNNGAGGTFGTALSGFPAKSGKVFEADYNGWWSSAGDIEVGLYFEWDKTGYRWIDWLQLPDIAAENNGAHSVTSNPVLSTPGYPDVSSNWVDGGTTTVDPFGNLTWGATGTGAVLSYNGTGPDIGAITTDQTFSLPPPVNDTPGAISPTGSQAAGTSITATKGTWVRVPSAWRYEWLRDSATVVRDSGFVTAGTDNYVLQAADVGHTITCRVTGQNSAGNSSPATDTGSVSAVSAGSGSTITVVQQTTPASGTSSVNPFRTIPAGTPGNVMYVRMVINTATDSTCTKMELGAAGSGKTFVEITPAGGVVNAANCRVHVWRRILQAGDTATQVTGTLTVARNNVIGVIELSNVDTTTPEDLIGNAGAGATGTSIANENTGPLTGTTVTGALLLGAVGSRNGHAGVEDTANESPNSGWTFAVGTSAAAGGGQVALASFHQLLVGSATNAIAAVNNTPSSDPWAGFIISVRPASGGTGSGTGGTDPSTFSPGPPQYWGNLSTAGTNPGWRPDEATYDANNPFAPPKLYYDNATTAVIAGGVARNVLRGAAVTTNSYWPRSEGFEITAATMGTPLVVTVPGHNFATGNTVVINDSEGTPNNLKPKFDNTYTVASVSGNNVTMTVGYTPTNGSTLRVDDGHRAYISKSVHTDTYHEVIVTETNIATAGDATGPYFTADGTLTGARHAGADGYWVWTGGKTNNFAVSGNSPGSLKIRIPGNLDVSNVAPDFLTNRYAGDGQLLNPFNSLDFTNVTVDIQGMGAFGMCGGTMSYSQPLNLKCLPIGEAVSWSGTSGTVVGLMNHGFVYDANKIGTTCQTLTWKQCTNYRNEPVANAGGGHTDCYQIWYLDNSALPPDEPTWEWCFFENGGNSQFFPNTAGGGSGTKIIDNCIVQYGLSWRGNKFCDLAGSSNVGARHCWINDDSSGATLVSPRPEPLDFGNGPPNHPYPTGVVYWPVPTDPMANIAVASDGTMSTTATHVARPAIPSGATFTYSN